MKHFLALEPLDAETLSALVARTLALKKAFAEGERPVCPKITVTNLFFENSTRTKTSFEIAQKRLGLDVVSLAVGSSSVAKGETLLDTVENLRAMGAKMFVVRHQASGACEMLARKVPQAHFINAGDGMHEHPTQGLLDATTLWEAWGGLRAKQIAILGDVRHSRVARSALQILPKLGAKITLFGPPTLVPKQLETSHVRIARDFRDATQKADAVMVLRLQHERMTQGFLPSLHDYTRGFGLTKQRAAELRADCLVMHPGPINRGVEIDDEVANSDRSLVLKQVENGVFARMATLQWVLQ